MCVNEYGSKEMPDSTASSEHGLVARHPKSKVGGWPMPVPAGNAAVLRQQDEDKLESCHLSQVSSLTLGDHLAVWRGALGILMPLSVRHLSVGSWAQCLFFPQLYLEHWPGSLSGGQSLTGRPRGR